MARAKRMSPEGESFAAEWNALDKLDRRRIRRLVRVGRPVETPAEAHLAVAYASFQNQRAAWRLFWFWFVPGLVIAILAAMSVHAILVGVVLAAGANAIFVHRNLRRVAKVNAALLSEDDPG